RERKQVARSLSFWDVRPQEGETARKQLARIEKQQAAGGMDTAITAKDGTSVAAAGPGGQSYVPVRDERVQVGKVVTQVQTGYEADAIGRRKSIDVNIGTFVSSEDKQK